MQVTVAADAHEPWNSKELAETGAENSPRGGLQQLRPSAGKIDLWPLAVLLVVALLVAVSVTPTVQLKTDPPADFTDVRFPGKAGNAALAGAYWETAVKVIQGKYARTSALPERIPDEFKPAGESEQAGQSREEQMRSLYWSKLREEWLLADNWSTAYRLDISWLTRDIGSIARSVVNFFRGRGMV